MLLPPRIVGPPSNENPGSVSRFLYHQDSIAGIFEKQYTGRAQLI